MLRDVKSFKINVCFEKRADGGLRVWSDDVPGFVLSHHDADAVLADIGPALEVILSSRLGGEVVTQPLLDVRDALEDHGLVDPDWGSSTLKEYVAHYAQ